MCLYMTASKERKPRTLIGGLLFYFAERKSPHFWDRKALLSPYPPSPLLLLLLLLLFLMSFPSGEL